MSEEMVQPQQPIDKTGKYHFFLSLTALILSATFGRLTYLTFASGTALSGEFKGITAQQTLLRFDIIGAVFIIMAPVSFLAAWKLGPGGD